MQFAQPGWLVLLALIPLPWILERARPRITWPTLSGFRGESRGKSVLSRLRWLPSLLRGLAIGAIGVALARPQTVGGVTRIAGQGVGIVVAIDQSSSMSTVDFPADKDTRRISRLEAAKATFNRFVESRPDDLIGLVSFANYPDLQWPPTVDHERLMEIGAALGMARPGDDGTNIGDAIAVGLDALRLVSTAKKVLILLTDGNNEPAVPHPLDPEEAAALARDLGITLHTIAVGRPDGGGIVRGTEPGTGLPVMREVEGPNTALLGRLATIAGGRTFFASDAEALDRIFTEINALERSPIRGEIRTRYDEHFAPWAGLALAILALDRILVGTRLGRLP